MNVTALAMELQAEEGSRLKPYTDTMGKLTIGVGRNLTDVGISADEEHLLLCNDIARAASELDANIPWWSSLPEAAQEALCDMCFNMGWGRLAGFHNMLADLQAGDFSGAAEQAMASSWSTQVGARAQRIAAKFRSC